MIHAINISQFNYELPTERIAKYPLEHRDQSKLLVYRDSQISQTHFSELFDYLSSDDLLVCNNTKVIRARLIFFKETGARIEIFCLEPSVPSAYEHAFSVKGSCVWHAMVGNAKKFNRDISLDYEGGRLTARRGEGDLVEFLWSSDHSFGELLEMLGRVPIPPYMDRDSDDTDTHRYQTTYAKLEGSVAAPTAGLHFTPEMLSKMRNRAEVTLHVGAGTFLPVKVEDARDHSMHVEFIEVTLGELEKLAPKQGEIIAVGTTSVRTLESLAALGRRLERGEEIATDRAVGQWEPYDDCPSGSELNTLLEYMQRSGLEKIVASTQIMITPQYKFRTIKGLITNFHQPQSTLLLLISAIVGERWREIYQYAMDNDFRFLSYGDSNLLML